MGSGIRCRREPAGRLDGDVDAQRRPRQRGWIALGEHIEATSLDDEVIVEDLDRSTQSAERAVVAQKLGEGACVGEIVDGHDLEIAVALDGGAEDVTADASESVDGYAGGHGDASPCEVAGCLHDRWAGAVSAVSAEPTRARMPPTRATLR